MRRILINRRNDDFWTALTVNGKLVELLQDFAKGGSVVGNIYAGIVKKINTEFIFVDIGLSRQVFIDSRDSREKALFNNKGKLCVKQGDILIVQILKDAFGEKGPLATTGIMATGRRAVVYRSVDGDKINISRKIDDADGGRLLKALKPHLPVGFSATVRTAAAGCDEGEIVEEILHLISKFDMHAQWDFVRPPAILQEEAPILKTLREITENNGIDEIVTDCAELFGQNLHPMMQLYSNPVPIFEHYLIQTQIDRLKSPRVWLKSGAFIVIEQTEACVVIDVNTGKSDGRESESAKLSVNKKAAEEIGRQLCLRNLSGIIIIDFITMKSRKNIEELTDLLRFVLAKDRIPAVVIGMTALGLMEVTRKRIRNAVKFH